MEDPPGSEALSGPLSSPSLSRTASPGGPPNVANPVLAPSTSGSSRPRHTTAWLIHWPPGSSIDVHDHGDSIGALAVVAGALDEDVVVGATTVTKTIRAGESLFLPRTTCTP